VLELRDVPLDSPLWGALYRANASGSGLAVQPREVHTHPYLDLAEFWSSNMGAPAKLWGPASLEKHRRWLERKGRIEMTMLTDPAEILEAFATLREMLHARFGRTTTGSALDPASAVRFHHRVLPRLLKEGRLRMLQMTADDRPISVFYGLASAGWRGCYFLGFDREWAGRIHLGRVAYAAVIERSAREGAAEFDFLKGAERVKYLWPVRTRGTLNADAYPLNMGSQLVRAGAAARDTAAALAKSAARIFSR
jgi:CelD/BcsL family acetyltransferase involved in cellulose biosynthesis